MKQVILKSLGMLLGTETAQAHCDIPCGIYDPHQAQIAALTVIRMDNIIAELKDADHSHDLSRATAVKEEHAELAKHEIRIIWGDFFKEEHFKKYPELHELTHNIMQAGSKARQGDDLAAGQALLKHINKFSEIFWEIKGVETKRVAAPYEPKSDVVYPVL